MFGKPRAAALQPLAVIALLTLIAVLVYGENARDGGWVGDAWLTRAWYVLYPHNDFFATVGHFLDLNSMSARPANAVYRVALNEWFGGDTEAWFAWQIASCVCMCFAIYALLRELGLAFLDATAIVVLLAIFPASAAIWLWSPVVHASLAIALAAVGFLLALRAFRAEGRRRLALHLASLLLFLLSLLLYEVCLPLILASFLLYALQAPKRQAARRWLVDCAVVVPLALLVSGPSESRGQDVAGSFSHAIDMATELPTLLFEKLLPFESAPWLAALALAALYAWGLRTMLRRVDDRVGPRLRRLFAVNAAGVVVIALGYLVYVPGLDYYHPLATGIGDRVNAIPALGWVLFLYSLVAVLATLLTQRLQRRQTAVVLLTGSLAVALGISWLAPIADESRAYVAATEEGDRVLEVVERAVPDPPRGSAIWTFGQPVEISPGVPVFANYWNMTGAVALSYHDRHIRSFVALPGTSFECRADGVVPGGNFEYFPPRQPGVLGRFGSRYGRTWFVDTVRGQIAAVDSRARCLEVSQTFPRSPQLPRGT